MFSFGVRESVPTSRVELARNFRSYRRAPEENRTIGAFDSDQLEWLSMYSSRRLGNASPPTRRRPRVSCLCASMRRRFGFTCTSHTHAGPYTNTASVVDTVPRVQGTWRGTSELQVDGVKLFATVTMNAHPKRSRDYWHLDFQSAVGLERALIQGVLNGTGAATTFAGTATVVAEVVGNTGRCHGQMSMSGSSSDISLRWTANQVTWQDCRGNAAGFVWILGR